MAEGEEPEKEDGDEKSCFRRILENDAEGEKKDDGAAEGRGERPRDLSRRDGQAPDVISVESEDGEDGEEKGMDDQRPFLAAPHFFSMM